MDIIRFNTENNEFIIELTKEEKSFSFSNFGKYNCHITFKDMINNPVVDIICNEKEIFNCLESLNCFQMNMGETLSDIIHFGNDNQLRKYMWYISNLDDPNIPTEEERLQISIYENYMGNNVLRIYLEMSYYYLEEFVYNLYRLIEDIPYLKEMSTTSLLEYMDYYGMSIPQ